jgi:hypothetical protein
LSVFHTDDSVPPGAFYNENRCDLSEAAFEAECRGGRDLECASSEAGGLRTPLEEINHYATEATHHSEYWPQSAAQLSNRLARATPLIGKDCIVERRR